MRRFASQVSAKSFDGLLVIEPEGTLEYIGDLHENGLPVVLIDDRGHRPQFPSVATSNRSGGQRGRRAPARAGRPPAAGVTGSSRFGCTQERIAGFADVSPTRGSRWTRSSSSRATSPSTRSAGGRRC